MTRDPTAPNLSALISDPYLAVPDPARGGFRSRDWVPSRLELRISDLRASLSPTFRIHATRRDLLCPTVPSRHRPTPLLRGGVVNRVRSCGAEVSVAPRVAITSSLCDVVPTLFLLFWVGGMTDGP